MTGWAPEPCSVGLHTSQPVCWILRAITGHSNWTHVLTARAYYEKRYPLHKVFAELAWGPANLVLLSSSAVLITSWIKFLSQTPQMNQKIARALPTQPLTCWSKGQVSGHPRRDPCPGLSSPWPCTLLQVQAGYLSQTQMSLGRPHFCVQKPLPKAGLKFICSLLPEERTWGWFPPTSAPMTPPWVGFFQPATCSS